MEFLLIKNYKKLSSFRIFRNNYKIKTMKKLKTIKEKYDGFAAPYSKKIGGSNYYLAQDVRPSTNYEDALRRAESRRNKEKIFVRVVKVDGKYFFYDKSNPRFL
jgi:hypothetical protein